MPDVSKGRLVICPTPPMLLPGATGRVSVPERERLLGEIHAAISWLCATREPVLVLAAGQGGEVIEGTVLDAAAFGVRYQATLGAAEPNAHRTPHTPGMLVAASLLTGRPARGVEVDDVDVAYRQANRSQPGAVLVMGGGSARRRDGAPGYLDPRAVPYDDSLVAHIGHARVDTLTTPDLDLADALLCDLARPLSVAARIAAEWAQPLRAQVDSYTADHGVANIVARWWTDA